MFFLCGNALGQGSYIAWVHENTRYGFIDTSGTWVIGPIKYVEVFSEGLAYAYTDSVRGYLNSEGKFQIVFGSEFAIGNDFHEGLAPVFFTEKRKTPVNIKHISENDPIPPPYHSLTGDTTNFGKPFSYGYIDQNGKMVIRAAYDFAGDFTEGLARVCIDCKDRFIFTKGGKFGFIDHSGKLIVPLIYNYADNFREGRAMVRKDGKFGSIDKNGQVVIPIVNEDVTGFWLNRAFVKKKGVYSLVNREGKYIKKKIPGMVGSKYFSEGLCAISINDSLIDKSKKGRHWSVIDTNGNTVAETDCDYIFTFHEGLAGACKNNKWGFIDKKGQWVIQPVFNWVRDFSCQLAAVKLNEKWGYIDRKGNWKIQPAFDSALEFEKVK